MVCQVLVIQLAKEKIKISEKLKMRAVGCVLVFWVCGFFNKCQATNNRKMK